MTRAPPTLFEWNAVCAGAQCAVVHACHGPSPQPHTLQQPFFFSEYLFTVYHDLLFIIYFLLFFIFYFLFFIFYLF